VSVVTAPGPGTTACQGDPAVAAPSTPNAWPEDAPHGAVTDGQTPAAGEIPAPLSFSEQIPSARDVGHGLRPHYRGAVPPWCDAKAARRRAGVALGAVARHRRPAGGVGRQPRRGADRHGRRAGGAPDHYAVPGVDRAVVGGKSRSAVYARACSPLKVVTNGTYRCSDCGWNYGRVCRGICTPDRREMRVAVRNGPFLVRT
jgi:hypothetical protein